MRMKWNDPEFMSFLYQWNKTDKEKGGVAACSQINEHARHCIISNFKEKKSDNIIEVDFRKLTAQVMLERIARDYPDAKAAFVIVWPSDGAMPEYFSNTTDEAVIMLRLQQFIHKWYNGDFAHAVDNPENQT